MRSSTGRFKKRLHDFRPFAKWLTAASSLSMLWSHSQPILQPAKELSTMATVDGGTLVGRVLQEQKVQYLFAINGGHTFPILANLTNHGIKLIHMRHEQATAYAADAWARTTGRPGVCCVTAGCGLTNAITGLCMAGLTNSAVVCLSGQHPTLEDGIGSFQEAYGSDICRTFAKYTRPVLDWQ